MREFAAKKAGDQIEHPDLTPAFNAYRKNPQCGTHCWVKNIFSPLLRPLQYLVNLVFSFSRCLKLNWPELVQINLEQFITSDPVASGAQFWTSCFLPASPLCFAGLAFLPPSASSSFFFFFFLFILALLLFLLFLLLLLRHSASHPKNQMLRDLGHGLGQFCVRLSRLQGFSSFPTNAKRRETKYKQRRRA